MNVLFVEKSLRIDKMGIAYLAAVLKEAGHDVACVQDDIESVHVYMSTHSVDVVCWSMMTCDSDWMFAKNRVLKKDFRFISIIGGPHPTFFSQEGVHDPDVDFVVVGAGESVICDILNGKITDKLVRGNIPDPNLLPHPSREPQYRYDDFRNSRMKRFIAGRYCNFSCKYCFNDQFKTVYKDQLKSLRNRLSVKRLMEDIDGVKTQYGLEHVVLNDDDIATNKDWLMEFCAEMTSRKLEWSGIIRASSVDLFMLQKMKDSGCEFITLAIESANENTQKFLNRGFITNQDVRNVLKWTKELGIKTRLLNIIGLPVEDPLADALETLKFNQEVKPTESIVSVFQPYQGTVLWKYCLEKGLIDVDTKLGTFYDGTRLKIPDASKINGLYHWWPYAVQYGLPLGLVEILSDIEISPEIQSRLQKYKWEYGKREFFGVKTA